MMSIGKLSIDINYGSFKILGSMTFIGFVIFQRSFLKLFFTKIFMNPESADKKIRETLERVSA